MLVKRLVCIEDLGDIDILITDKTGTLTEGRIRLVDTVGPAGAHSESVRRVGLLATDVDPESGGVSANPLDAALWESPQPRQLVGGACNVSRCCRSTMSAGRHRSWSMTAGNACLWSKARPSKS